MGIVVVDIDGTIANIGHRRHFVEGEKKNWKAFNEGAVNDTPHMDIVDLVSLLSHQHHIVFCTGRHEEMRDITKKFIHSVFAKSSQKINTENFRGLLMRQTNDKREDEAVKYQLLKDANINFDDIVYVLEDRQGVVDMWREQGLRVLQVAPGDF